MERVNTLINKLQQQITANENARQLLYTAQLLVAELSFNQELEQVGKVSVMMPHFYVDDDTLSQGIKVAIIENPKLVEEIKLIEEPTETANTLIEKTIAGDEVELETPLLIVEEKIAEKEIEAVKFTNKPEINTNRVLHTLIVDASDDIPTLGPKDIKPSAEVNDLSHNTTQSLNEVLKENKKEVVTTLVDAPVKDLRKAIGINDKYVFINELFSGDEAMYERSIKTINNFSVYPEAEHWIKRELYTKLCWLENSPTVESFYNAVRRRFV
ncbi:MAG: hypothetical protein NTZ59_07835 [Bacteroidetes bacterium]|jgi:hypothetical protein|nr:hypothetical protein [Bacteroidota bacterium]